MTAVVHSEVGSIPVLVDPHVPLFATKRDELGRDIGADTERPVLFWIIFGRIHVHPERLEEFRVHITSSKQFPYAKVTG
jgi:hypothetical protein